MLWQRRVGAPIVGEARTLLPERDHPTSDDGWRIDTSPLCGAIHTLPPITVAVARQSNEELWDHLVRYHHYLGYQKLLGQRLKYLAFIGDRPVAALSFSAPALKLRVRDAYIGWSSVQRKTYLTRIVNNSRFLILPWVAVKNLASCVLARTLARLSRDWEEHFGRRVWMVETFVDPARFSGTSYRAANFIHLGSTYGSGKQGKGYVYHGVVKEVYVYALETRFRELIGCEQKPYLFHRPSRSMNVEAKAMVIRPENWNPAVMPRMKLSEDDVRALADELVTFHEEYTDCFGRTEHERLGLAYLSGLLSNAPAKSVEPIALELLDARAVRSLQKFMKNYHWDHERMATTHQELLARAIASPEGMLSVDSSESVKKGKESVGVARQYCGEAGKVENCQSGVFVGYASEKGYGLLNCRLYMPEVWFTKEYEERRVATLVPENCAFQKKPDIARDLLHTVIQSKQFPAKWVGCDASFGSDWTFLESLPEGLSYFAGIHSHARVFLTKPKVGLPIYKGRGPHPKTPRVLKGRSYTVREVAASRNCPWSRVVLAEGAKGPITAAVACMRVWPSRYGLPADPLWLFIRRSADGEIKYAFSNAPADVSFEELCRASTLRWPIEQCFQDGKSHVGMNQYEHRSWPAWHRHMVYVFLALHFLLRLRLRFKKNSYADAAAGPLALGGCAAAEIAGDT